MAHRTARGILIICDIAQADKLTSVSLRTAPCHPRPGSTLATTRQAKGMTSM